MKYREGICIKCNRQIKISCKGLCSCCYNKSRSEIPVSEFCKDCNVLLKIGKNCGKRGSRCFDCGIKNTRKKSKEACSNYYFGKKETWLSLSKEEQAQEINKLTKDLLSKPLEENNSMYLVNGEKKTLTESEVDTLKWAGVTVIKY